MNPKHSASKAAYSQFNWTTSQEVVAYCSLVEELSRRLKLSKTRTTRAQLLGHLFFLPRRQGFLVYVPTASITSSFLLNPSTVNCTYVLSTAISHYASGGSNANRVRKRLPDLCGGNQEAFQLSGSNALPRYP